LLHLIDKRNKNKSKNSQKKKQWFHGDPPSDDIGLCIGNLFGKTVCPPGLHHILSKSVPEIFRSRRPARSRRIAAFTGRAASRAEWRQRTEQKWSEEKAAVSWQSSLSCKNHVTS